ncbi:uncharacterized protein [Primulina eburnea]|uniref:uncharacterized protein isoform X2 n=1 Tax=Primulina eburnea TaxID=1245227 RepID=UPI003C6C7E0D
METVVDEEAKVKDNFTEINGTTVSPPKTDDPVVYHLVRVVGDGTLVPATADQVMTVKDLLDDDKIEGRIISDTAQTLKCAHSGSDLNTQFKISEGLLQRESLEVDAGELGLPPDLEVDSKKMDIRDEENIHRFTSDRVVDQSRPSEKCSKISGLGEDGSSTSAIGISMMPDFSLLKGEIHLDNLTMKELQETFKATFGRETSVKDKRWLKRRIIMGLTNSCDFSVTTLVITDNRVVKKGKGEICKCAGPCATVDCVVQSSREDCENSTCSDDQKAMHSNGNRTNVQSFTTQENCGSKDGSAEERPAKRVRKPTRRYIEELSEGEPRDSDAKIISSGRQPPACNQPSAKVQLIPVQTVVQDAKCLMRQDSLGGSGVQVPYVSRVRRSRPRESFMTLTKLQLSDIGLPTSLVKNNVSCSEKLRNEIVDKVFEAGLSPRLIEVPVSFPEEGMPPTEKEVVHLEKEAVSQNVRPHTNGSDDKVVTVAKESGGTRRKHHRPWTLSEVVKLVEGVAKYGAGRWSEIKRAAFLSCSYRTSVDLKDKWRNLLRASLAELPARDGIHASSRKNASIPIPAQILSRVRELADAPAQDPPSLGFDGNLHEWG